MATLTAIRVGGRVSGVGVGSERGNLHTQRDDTSLDDSNDPLSKESSQRLTVRAPTVLAPETTRPRETWVPLWRGESEKPVRNWGKGD